MANSSFFKRLKKRASLVKQAIFLPELNFSLEKNKGRRKFERLVTLGLFITVIILAAIIFYLSRKTDLNNLAGLNTDSVQKLEESISKVVKVDSSTTPTVAQITDIASLKKQNPTLYTNAANDDLVIIYPDKAIIYRPSENKIISIIDVK